MRVASPQVLLVSSAEQLQRAQELFPRFECQYLNGGDYSTLQDRRCVCMGEMLAHFAQGYASETKVLPDDFPTDLTPDDALTWAKANAAMYSRAPNEDVDVARLLDIVENDSDQRFDTPNSMESRVRVDQSAPPENPAPVVAAASPETEAAGNVEPPVRFPPSATALAPEAPPQGAGPDDVPTLATRPRTQPSAPERGYEGADDWPAPVDFWSGEGAPLAKSTADMLPSWLWDYVSDQSSLRGVDPVQATLHTLIAISGAMHQSIGIRPKPGEPDYVERPVLWGATVGVPATKKDVGQAIAVGALTKIDADMRMKAAARMQEHTDADFKYQEELATWRKGKQLGPRPIAPEAVDTDRLLVSNYTMEGLRSVLQNNSRQKVLVVARELSGIFGNADAFGNSSKVSKDLPMMLQLFDSAPMIFDRAAPAPPVYIKSWTACIAGNIQPSIFARVISKLNLKDDGMLQRFLIVVSGIGNEGEDRPADMVAASAYKRMLAAAVELHAAPEPCWLSAGAQAIRSEFVKWVYRTANSGTLPDGLASAIGKFEGYFARLCLVMHGAECAHANMPVIAPEIHEVTALRVQALLLGLFYPHAERFYRDTISEGSTYYRNPQIVAAFILATGAEAINITMLWRSLSLWRHIEARQRTDTMRSLVEAGWLRKDGESSYAVNPRVHEAFSAQAQLEAERREKFAAAMAEKMPSRRREPGQD